MHTFPPAAHGVPESFLTKFGNYITAVLSGFDRIRFRAVLRLLFRPQEMDFYLSRCGVLIKDFKAFAEEFTRRVKAAAYQAADARGRPVQYIADAQLSKEELARQIAQRDGIREGLIALFGAVEPCYSFSVRGDRASRQIHLVLEQRRCTHLYHYYMHHDFGLMHVRVQSWFPFTVTVGLNGRNWLARQMDQAGINYRRCENCFLQLSDPGAAQALMNQQLQTDWPKVLGQLLKEAHPLAGEIIAPLNQGYYWSAAETEYATDLLFDHPKRLAGLYPQFLRHGLSSFQCTDVLRFLGKNRPEVFCGELKGTLKHRAEGLRLKHTVNGNSLKVYDKEGQVLRVETTINRPRDFRVYRPTLDDPNRGLKWQELRYGVADLYRRAEVSHGANARYLEALASVTGRTPLHQEALGVCRAIILKGHRYRALNPWSLEDGKLLELINRGEFQLRGLRNRDLRVLFFSPTKDKKLQRRQAAAITRRILLLRAHGLLRKVGATHRYHLTKRGQRIVTALLAARNADVDALTKIAA
jgi:hypothetical protein